MKDIRFISITDAIKIVSISEVDSSTDSRILRIATTGGVPYTSRVYINGLGIDDFTATSATVLLVTLPSTLDTVSILDMDVSVSSARLTSTSTPADISFGTTMQFGHLEGIQKLIQQVLKGMLSNSESNRFAPDEGGNLLKGLSSTAMTPDGRARVSSVVQASIMQTMDAITKNQAGIRLPSDERLLSLEMLSLDFDSLEMSVSARIQLTTYAGTSYSIPLAL